MSAIDPTPSAMRPLSPHLGIYKPQISTVMSILHRLTGLALAAGTLFLVGWLWSAAYSPHCFTAMHSFFGSIIGKIMLFGWSVAFYYHLLNGIRHLFWDIGKGFELPAMERSGWLVAVACLALTMITWILAFSVSGVTP